MTSRLKMVDISFVTSCFNSEEFLDGLIENLSQQSNPNYEHIIVDSQSTDRSVEIIKKWQARDPRVKLLEQPKRTPYGVSWLEGWHVAKGDIVCNTNSDDRSYPWRGIKVLERYRNAQLASDAPHSFYYGGYETRVDGVVTAKGIPPSYTELDLQQFFRCGVHVHWDNKLRDVVDWDLMIKAGHEYRSAFDYWLVLYFMSLGAKGRDIASCFSIYNQRKDSLEQSDKERSNFEAMRAMQTFYPDGPSAVGLETETKFKSPDYYKRYQDFLHEFS